MALQNVGSKSFTRGDKVWFDINNIGIQPGVVNQIEDDSIVVQSEVTMAYYSITDKKRIQQRMTANLHSSIDDLIYLDEISESMIVWNLKNRYCNNQTYTWSGRNILLSLNPYRLEKNGFDEKAAQSYKILKPGHIEAHLYALGTHAYNQMIMMHRNQSIIFCGDSGSGKTENFKLLLKFMTETTPFKNRGIVNKQSAVADGGNVDALLHAAVSIVESFGCARSCQNPNSNRVVTMVKLFYQLGCRAGAEIKCCMLEKSRLVGPGPGERNFHIFYQMLAGLKANLKEKFGLTTADKQFYLNLGGCIDCANERNDRDEFSKLETDLELFGLTTDQLHSIWRILSAILHLGNIYFQKNQNGETEIANDAECRWVAYLLQLDHQRLVEIFNNKASYNSMKANQNQAAVDPHHSIDAALDIRDSIAKAVYSELFQWILVKINQHLQGTQTDSSIALLDFYGFENNKVNSLEQLLRNYSDDKTQEFLEKIVFRDEQLLYHKEKLKWEETMSPKFEIGAVIELLSRRPQGIIQILDDETSFPKGSDESFLQKCIFNHVDNALFGTSRAVDKLDFHLKHHSGLVWYQVPGLLERNRQVLTDSILNALAYSQNMVMTYIISRLKQQLQKSHQLRLLSSVSQYCSQIQQIFHELHDNSEVHFVKCLLPNREQQTGKVDFNLLRSQVKHGAVPDIVKIKRDGFPIHLTMNSFVARYRSIVNSDAVNGKSHFEASSAILKAQGQLNLSNFQIGTNRVFLKQSLWERLERHREMALRNAAIQIQKNVRAHLKRKRFLQQRHAAVKLQSGLRGYVARKKYKSIRETSGLPPKKSILINRNATDPAASLKQQQIRSIIEAVKFSKNETFPVAAVQHLPISHELSDILKSLENWPNFAPLISQSVVKVSPVESVAEQHPIGLTVLPHDLHLHQFAKFVEFSFKGQIWQMRREPIVSPFLMHENEQDFQLSIQMFNLVLRFMNDNTLTSSQEIVLANAIIQKALDNEGIRDELYCQLINQTHQNPSPENALRGWILMAGCTSTFSPSQELYKYLLNYVITAISSSLAINNVRSLIEQKMHCAGHTEGINLRRGPPCLLEWSGIARAAQVAITAKCADMHEVRCQLGSWTTANEFAQQVLRARGFKEACLGPGWTVSLHSPQSEYMLSGQDYIFDALAYLERPPVMQHIKPPCIIVHHSMPAHISGSFGDKIVSKTKSDENIPEGPISGSALNRRYATLQRPVDTTKPLFKKTADATLSFPDYSSKHSNQKHERSIPIDVQNFSKSVMPNNEHQGQSDSPPPPPPIDYSAVRTLKHLASSVTPSIPDTKRIPSAIEPGDPHPSSPDINHRSLSHADDSIGRLSPDHTEPLYATASHYSQSDVYQPLQSEFSAASLATHVRGIHPPSNRSDVDKYLDALFEPVLQDSTLEEIYERRSLAASIKGTGGTSAAADVAGASSSPPPKMTHTASITIPLQQTIAISPRSTFTAETTTSAPSSNQTVVMMVPMQGFGSFHQPMYNVSDLSQFSTLTRSADSTFVMQPTAAGGGMLYQTVPMQPAAAQFGQFQLVPVHLPGGLASHLHPNACLQLQPQSHRYGIPPAFHRAPPAAVPGAEQANKPITPSISPHPQERSAAKITIPPPEPAYPPSIPVHNTRPSNDESLATSRRSKSKAAESNISGISNHSDDIRGSQLVATMKPTSNSARYVPKEYQNEGSSTLSRLEYENSLARRQPNYPFGSGSSQPAAGNADFFKEIKFGQEDLPSHRIRDVLTQARDNREVQPNDDHFLSHPDESRFSQLPFVERSEEMKRTEAVNRVAHHHHHDAHHRRHAPVQQLQPDAADSRQTYPPDGTLLHISAAERRLKNLEEEALDMMNTNSASLPPPVDQFKLLRTSPTKLGVRTQFTSLVLKERPNQIPPPPVEPYMNGESEHSKEEHLLQQPIRRETASRTIPISRMNGLSKPADEETEDQRHLPNSSARRFSDRERVRSLDEQRSSDNDWVVDSQLDLTAAGIASATSRQQKEGGAIKRQPAEYDQGFYKSRSEFSPADLQNQDLYDLEPVINHSSTLPKRKGGPFYTYKDTAWNLYVRKELFLPGETLSDPTVVDLVCLQVIRDIQQCNPYRIRRQERVAMLHLLDSLRVRPDYLEDVSDLLFEHKREIIDFARQWPLYFARLYPVVESRQSEYVAQVLCVHESGLRLVARNFDNPEEPFRILDHFNLGIGAFKFKESSMSQSELMFEFSSYDDLLSVEVTEPGDLLSFETRSGLVVRLFTDRAQHIADLLQHYTQSTQGYHQHQYVRALADYQTQQPNLLNFRKGDVIQVLSSAQNDYYGSGWLYGKLAGRVGNFPADYVESISALEIERQEKQGTLNRLSNYPPPALDELGTMERESTLAQSRGPPGGGAVTMMEFAMMYFRQPHPNQKRSEDGGGKTTDKKTKRDWTWREIADLVKFTKTPLSASLLRLENPEFNRMAQESFVAIMQYMQDYPLRKGQSFADCVYHLLSICHKNPPMRDEIYCQIMKQTTNNKSSQPDSPIKGWRLFSILTSYFDCSQILKPYLLKYLGDAAGDIRRAYHGTAAVCLYNLKQTFKYGGRRFLLGSKEIEAVTLGKNLKRQIYHLPGGAKRVINTKSVTVVEEVIRDLSNELNVLSSLEQQEFCLCYVLEQQGVIKLLANDEYVLDVCTELEQRQADYFLLLKRTVWIHPLRLDTQLYIDVMFFQMVPDYLEGLLVIMKSADTVAAQVMDDIAMLGALLYRADESQESSLVNERTVTQVLPRIVQNMRAVNAQHWADRVNTKLRQTNADLSPNKARAKFLETLSKWPLFGSTFFYLMHVSDPRIESDCLLAVNRHGLQFLHLVTHQTLMEFRLTEVLSTHKSAHPAQPGLQFLDLKVGNLLQQRVIALQTEQGAEISRLLGQYIYVDSQNRGFINGPGHSPPMDPFPQVSGSNGQSAMANGHHYS